MSLAQGTRLGPYDVSAQIGVGGMGEVYRARDTRLGRDVALKILPDAFAQDADRLARFRREAHVLASLNHPHIAQIYGLEDSGGVHALVMELVDGVTLDEYIRGAADHAPSGHPPAQSALSLSKGESEARQGTEVGQRPPTLRRPSGASARPRGTLKKPGLPAGVALSIARQIAEALEAAHERGIIHRDLKPANIKVRDDGTVKVLDFGLARAMEPAAMSGSASVSMSPTITTPPFGYGSGRPEQSRGAAMTAMGMILGTAAYMSPEQAKGRPADARADVWAFGAVLYEMVTGRRAFEGDDVSDTLANVLKMDPDWSALPEDLPLRVQQVIRACLQKAPKQRMGSIQDVRLALDGAFETAAAAPAAPGATLPRSSWQRPLLALAGTGLLAVGGLAGFALTRSPDVPATVARFTVPLPADQVFAGTGRRAVAISPDGRLMAYTSGETAVAGTLWLRPIDDLTATEVRGSSGARNPSFSPDGQWIVFFADGELKRAAVTGGTPSTICRDVTNPYGVSWGDDGVILFGQDDGIYAVVATGGKAERVITTEPGEQVTGPERLPGGDWVLFTLRPSGADWDDSRIVAQSLGTGARAVLLEGGRDARYVETGHLVYGNGGVVFAAPFVVSTRKVTGGPVSLIESVGMPLGQAGPMHLALARNGTLVYVAGTSADTGNRTLVWVDRSGREEPIAVPPRAYTYARLSPDGRQVALDSRDEQNDIWTFDLARGTLARLTRDPGLNRGPAWTPDGTRLAFSATDNGVETAHWQAADGSGTMERLGPADRRIAVDDFTPDGQQGLFITPFSPPYDIGVLSIDTGEIRMLLDTSASESNPALSPDGRWLAYQSTEDGSSQIYLRPFPDVAASRQKVSTAGGTRPLWSRDGKELFYYVDITRGNPVAAIMAVPVTLGDQVRLGIPTAVVQGDLARPRNAGVHYDVSSDRKRFLLLKDVAPPSGQTNQTPTLVVVLNWLEELKARVPRQ